MVPNSFSPVNSGYEPGEPFDSRHALLEAYVAAKKAEMAAQVDGDLDTRWKAGWAVTDALGELDSHRHHQAHTLVMMLRDALATCPDSLSELLSQVLTFTEHADALTEHADAIAALEDRVAQIADAVAALTARKGVLS